MSAFHRIDDVRAMPALRFINFALRLPAYKGVLRVLIEAEAHDKAKGELPERSRGQAATPAPSNDIRKNRVVDSDAATLLSDPAFAGLLERKAPSDG